MNKIVKGIIAVLAGVEVIFYLISPLAIASLLIILGNPTKIIAVLINAGGLLATVYRAIKVGFLKE